MIEWIRSILIYTIFFSLILYISPDEKYKRYIQTAIGFVMIIVVISPIVNMLGFSRDLSFNIRYEMADLDYIDSEDSYYSDVMSSIIKDDIYTEYGMKSDVNVLLDDEKKLTTIEISDTGADEETKKNIRSNLSSKYGINEDMIIIY